MQHITYLKAFKNIQVKKQNCFLYVNTLLNDMNFH